MIEPQTKVKVLRVDGTRIVIRPATDAELQDLEHKQQEQITPADHSNESPQPGLSPTEQSPEPEEKLDFPFPEG